LRIIIVRRVNAETMQALAAIFQGNLENFVGLSGTGFSGDLRVPQNQKTGAATYDSKLAKFRYMSRSPKRAPVLPV
jgi:hypothetical protein